MRISLVIALTFSVTAHAVTFHVAPDGASLNGARDAIRKLKAAGPLKEAVRVEVAAGTYRITEPLVLEAQDSGTSEFPITYAAAPGARPIISGGRKIEGFQVGPDGVWTAQVGAARPFECLWVNGERAVRARTPNSGYIEATSAATAPVAGAKVNGTLGQLALNIPPEAAGELAELNDAQKQDANVVVYHSWQTSRHRLAGVDAALGTLQFTGPARWGFFESEPYHRLHFENYRAALDAPGEWFLSREGVLSYIPRPGETPATAEVIAPAAAQWLVLRGDAEKDERVEHVRFVGLRFSHQEWTLPEAGWSSAQADPELPGAIEADGAGDVVFEDCEFSHTHSHAIRLRHGVRDVRLVHCDLHDLGAGGVYIGETAIPKDGRGATGRVTIENCILRSGGRYFPGSIGIWIGQSGDNAIVHCDIGDWYYTAISTGWVWGFKPNPCMNNRIEFCHLHHLGWGVLSDLGAVYTLGPSAGSVIRGCRVHDIACSSYGGWGLYNDEGSTGILWENNLVYRTQSGGYHQHYGKENIVRNNIFAFAQEMQLRHSRTEDHLAFTFEQNIVLFDDGKLLGHVDAGWKGEQVKLTRNLYWKRDGTAFDFAGKSFAEWQASGQDAGSLIADPMFVDTDKGDFHLRAGSPAERIGFKPFDYSLAGVSGDDAWKRLAAAPLPEMTFGAKPQAPPLSLRDGFENGVLGKKPSIAHVSEGEKAGAIAVSDERPSKGARCLKITDGPEITPPFNPHFFYHPNHRSGTTRVAFDLRVEQGIHFVHEWRRTVGEKYRTGPMLMVENGKVSVPGRVLMDLPANAWARFDIASTIGEKTDAVWTLTVTVAGEAAQRFDGLKYVNADMTQIDWIGFVSAGREAASYWLDELEITNAP